MRLPFPWTALSGAIVLAGLLAAGAHAETPGLHTTVNPEGFAALGNYFDENPELKETRSSGWKPFNRLLWFAETRACPDGTTPAIERQRALETARARRPLERGSGWFTVGPMNMSGRTVSLAVDPSNSNTVYVGSASGGLWKTTNGGDSWTAMTDDLASTTIGGVCVLAANPNVVLIGGGEGSGAGFNPTNSGNLGFGVMKSTDAGVTWGTTSLSYPVSGTHGFNVIRENSLTGTILAGANDGLWRSTDQGDTWAEVQVTGNFFDVKWKPGDANRVYITKGRDPFGNTQSNNGVKVSTDDGQTFTISGTGQPSGPSIAKTKIAVSAADPSVIYAHYVSTAGWGTLGIYRSTDDGATWQVRNNTINMTNAQGWYNCGIAVDPDDPDVVTVAGVQLWRSTDGGATYVNLNPTSAVGFGTPTIPHWDNHVIDYEPGSSDNLWIGTDGGVWRSTDDGATWASRREGIVSYQYYDICVAQTDPQFMMGGAQDNGIPTREGTTWFESNFFADGMVCNVHPNNADKVFAEWQFGNQIKSTDAGHNWLAIQSGAAANGGGWVTAVDQDQVLGGRLYMGLNAGIYRTTTGGIGGWTLMAPHHARWISVGLADGAYVWTTSNSSGTWVSSDSGVTWTNSALSVTGTETKIEAHPTDVNTAWVTYGGYGATAKIQMTTDVGATWADVTGDFPNIPANTFIADPAFPDDWYVGSDVGVWLSTNGGANWAPVGSNLPNVVVTDLEIRRDARKLVAGTFGRGAWETDLTPIVATSVVSPFAAASPDLMLDAPAPNPVRDQTQFRFAARAGVSVALRVYDVAGRLVNTVADNVPSDGVIRNASWFPDGAPDGVYFVVLEAGRERVSRKVVVTR